MANGNDYVFSPGHLYLRLTLSILKMNKISNFASAVHWAKKWNNCSTKKCKPQQNQCFFNYTRVPVSSQYTRVVWECAKNPY